MHCVQTWEIHRKYLETGYIRIYLAVQENKLELTAIRIRYLGAMTGSYVDQLQLTIIIAIARVGKDTF